MLSQKSIQKIISITSEYWNEQIQAEFFQRILSSGKEVGHSLADNLDDMTETLLSTHVEIGFQMSKKNDKKSSRSMGDFWVLEGGHYHPVNIKTGITGHEGRPNMVSLKRLLREISKRTIDSYYLLYLKINPNSSEVKVVFVDMLEYLDYLSFDAGPGQIMLDAGRFFREYPNPKHRKIVEKINYLLQMLENGNERLIRNRARDLLSLQKAVGAFISSSGPLQQQSLKIKPHESNQEKKN